MDEETGLYYYGARYYNPRESVWLSVAPLMEKYPNISPYAYAALNPVKYIDPDGRDIIIGGVSGKGGAIVGQYKYSKGQVYYRSGDGLSFGDWSEYSGELTDKMREVVGLLDQLSANSQGRAKLIDFFDQQGNDVSIKINRNQKGSGQAKGSVTIGMPRETPVEGNRSPGEISPEYVTLAHEMAHAKSYKLGIQNTGVWVDGAKQMLTDNVTIDEIYTTHIENKVRAAAGLKLRPSYVPSERTYSDVLEGSKSLYINKNGDYPKVPLQKVSRNDAFDYSTIKKDGSN